MKSMTWLAALGLSLALDEATLRHTTPLADHVSLSLVANRDGYYRGEVVRLSLVVENTSQQPTTGHFDPNPRFGMTRIYHRQPGSPAFVELSVIRQAADGHWLGPISRTLGPREKRSVEVPVAVTSYEAGARAFVLDAVGRHAFKVTYDDTPGDPNGRLESNVLEVDVLEPPAAERPAQSSYTPTLAYLAKFPWERGRLTASEMRAAADFIQQFPDSRHTELVRAGLRTWLSGQTRIPGQGTPEERALWDKLFADSTPPLLSLSASPSRLWPPNHKLMPISVVVNVTDDKDARPAVKLVSITCDDQCNPVIDIGNAEPDVDDRSFELRAERLGTGSDRTYTITYSAEDASGNKAMATTKVTVPHDQRGKK